MSEVWGPWVKNAYNFRAGLRYSTDTQPDRVNVSLVGLSQSAQSTINYGKSVLEYTEDGSTFHNLANVYPSVLGYGQTVTNSSASDWWTRVYGRDRSIYLQHWFSSPDSSISEYVTGGRAGAWVTIPARAYERPKAPLSPSLVRDSDSSVTLAWKANYTGSSEAYPWTGVNVYRSVDGGQWAKLGSVSWDKTGYTDATTSANHRYDYKVRSYNGTGESEDASCGTAYTTPSSPSSATVVRSSDTSQRVSWGLGENASATWGSVVVQRSVDGGDWAKLATLSGTATNYTDNGTSADHAYSYRVASANADASSGWVSAGTVCTTPAAPKSVTAAATGAATVSVSATGLSAIASAFDVEHRAGASGEWGETTRVAALPTAMASAAGENFYRVRAVRDGLASAWTASEGVITVAQPKAPTVTGVAARYATGSKATVSWAPNHPDGSEQTAAQAELTDPSGKASTKSVTGSSTSVATAALSKGHWSVRVRTRGAWAEGDGWGEWSQAVEFDVYDPPKVSVTSPGAEVDRMPIAVSWDASDETGIASQLLEVCDAVGAVVLSERLAGDVRSDTIDASRLLPNNGASYSVRVTVTGGSSLSASSTAAFKVAWNSPATPAASLSYADDLSVRVRVSFGDAEGLPATSYASVYRRAGGEDVQIASSLADGEEVVDRMAPLNSDYSYAIVAHSESGSQTEAVVPAHLDSMGAEAFSFGQDASRCVALALDADVSDTVAHSGETFHFALGDGVANLPTFYPDGLTDATGSRSYAVTSVEQYLELRSLAGDPSNAVCWYRDHWGGRHRVTATWQTSYSSASYSLWKVSANVTEVIWEEPLHG